MLSSYIESKLKEAKYEKLKDGTYYGEIGGLRGLWANAKTLKKCKEEMREVLEEWLVIKIQHGDYIPGFTPSLTFPKKFLYA